MFGDFNPRSPCGERLFWPSMTCGPFQISIHAPLAGSDHSSPPRSGLSAISIHAPLAGSDIDLAIFAIEEGHFNPRSPCGERRSKWTTHAPNSPFQSTLPLRGATIIASTKEQCIGISIHAPLAGSDVFCGDTHQSCFIISIHAPLAGSDLWFLWLTYSHQISIHAPLAGSDDCTRF